MTMLEEPSSLNMVGSIHFGIALLGGTGSSIAIKLMFQTQAVGVDGVEKRFEKPLLLTFVMFLAMAFAMPAHWLMEYMRPHEKRRKRVSSRVMWFLLVPSIFDLVGTHFAQTGLVFTTVSFYQLLRCTVIIVTAFLKVFVLHNRLKAHMWWGVAVNIISMVVVSLTSLVGPADDSAPPSSNPVLGAAFILMSCLIQGIRYIFEEKVMAVDDAPPLVVVGMEGVWGTVIMLLTYVPIAAALPGGDAGSIENTWDSLVMLSNSDALQVMLGAYFLTVTTYNISCIYVTAYLSAIWHAILDNFRPVTVWAVGLLIFLVTDGAFGEEWTPSSWIQLAGMLILFIGTAIYNGSLRLPFLDYDTVGTSLLSKQATPSNMSSPALMRSPLLRRLSREYESPMLTRRFSARAAAHAEQLDHERGHWPVAVMNGEAHGLLVDPKALYASNGTVAVDCHIAGDLSRPRVFLPKRNGT